MENKAKRHSIGRQKIEIKKIKNKSNLQVTFSKRRAGLFKKAGELSVVCGAEVAVVVKSPADKVYSFGNPSADTVLDRFNYAGNPNYSSTVNSPHDVDGDELGVQRLSKKYFEVLGELEAKMKQEKLTQGPTSTSENGDQKGCWWDETNIDELGLNELEHYIASLETLKKNVMNQADAMAMAMASSSLSSFMALDVPVDPFDNTLAYEGTGFDFGCY